MITIRRFERVTTTDELRYKEEFVDTYLFGFRIKRDVREAWRKAGNIDPALREQVFDTDNRRCVYCGAMNTTTKQVTLSVDHIIPQSQGGLNTLDNLVTACKSCNSSKQTRTPTEAIMPLSYGRFRHGDVSTHIAGLKKYRPNSDCRGVIAEFSGKSNLVPEYDFVAGNERDIRKEFAIGVADESCLTWGYHGSGPIATAYSILRDLYGPVCARKYQYVYYEDVIAKLPKDDTWIIWGDAVTHWLDKQSGVINNPIQKKRKAQSWKED